MSVSRSPSRAITRVPEPAPVATGAGNPVALSGVKNPQRTSQFVLSSKITNAPQTSFLAVKTNTAKANKIAKQAQVVDPRLTADKAKRSPAQRQTPNNQGASATRGRPSTFFNQDGITTMVAKMPPNESYLRSHNLTSPGQAKTQAAARLGYSLLA